MDLLSRVELFFFFDWMILAKLAIATDHKLHCYSLLEFYIYDTQVKMVGEWNFLITLGVGVEVDVDALEAQTWSVMSAVSLGILPESVVFGLVLVVLAVEDAEAVLLLGTAEVLAMDEGKIFLIEQTFPWEWRELVTVFLF